MIKAINIFNGLEKGILNIIKAADIYALHIIANIRNQEPEKEVINELLGSNKISWLNFLGVAYKNEDIQILEKDGQLKHIGQQILLSTYTAFEIYLIEKFKEYYRCLSKNKEGDFLENTLKRFSFRSIKNIAENYYELLKINLPSFDIEYFSDDKSSFQPKNSWEAINLISIARNEIAHIGESKKYKIVTLMDSWYPFEFIRRWVSLFDCNFDSLIYEKKETNLIKVYKERLYKFEKSKTVTLFD